MFVGRLNNEVVASLSELSNVMKHMNIVELDLSHNALGPAGIKSIEPFLVSTTSLKILRVNNTGLGEVISAIR